MFITLYSILYIVLFYLKIITKNFMIFKNFLIYDSYFNYKTNE